jgi:hypothetical protein
MAAPAISMPAACGHHADETLKHLTSNVMYNYDDYCYVNN